MQIPNEDLSIFVSSSNSADLEWWPKFWKGVSENNWDTLIKWLDDKYDARIIKSSASGSFYIMFKDTSTKTIFQLTYM